MYNKLKKIITSYHQLQEYGNIHLISNIMTSFLLLKS